MQKVSKITKNNNFSLEDINKIITEYENMMETVMQ